MKYLAAKVTIYSLYLLSLLWLILGVLATITYIKDRSQLSPYHPAYQAIFYLNAILIFPLQIDPNRLPFLQITIQLFVCGISILIIEYYR
jgi:hypothetical protein